MSRAGHIYIPTDYNRLPLPHEQEYVGDDEGILGLLSLVTEALEIPVESVSDYCYVVFQEVS
jgi:hypothetical protein